MNHLIVYSTPYDLPDRCGYLSTLVAPRYQPQPKGL